MLAAASDPLMVTGASFVERYSLPNVFVLGKVTTEATVGSMTTLLDVPGIPDAPTASLIHIAGSVQTPLPPFQV